MFISLFILFFIIIINDFILLCKENFNDSKYKIKNITNVYNKNSIQKILSNSSKNIYDCNKFTNIDENPIIIDKKMNKIDITNGIINCYNDLQYSFLK